MTTAQYLAALKRLGLTPYGKATAKALGVGLDENGDVVSVRQLANYANGTTPIPPMLERLLECLLAGQKRPARRRAKSK